MQFNNLLNDTLFAIIDIMNNEKDNYQKIKVSKSAYRFLKEKSKLDKYHGRGIIGVVDDLTIGEFTTTGSGSYLKNKQSKKL